MSSNVIGKGSYGTVFSEDGKYAIKQMLIKDTTWIKETLITKYLQSENVINFLSISHDKGHNIMLKKNTDNIHVKMHMYRCLRDITLKNDRDILLVLRDISNALALTHKKNILHRDVKECNVLLEYRKGMLIKAYLADFGLALSDKLCRNLSDNVVTASHRPPEIIKKISYDNKIDTWGFGMILLFLVTGRHFMMWLKYNSKKFTELVVDRHSFLNKLQKFISAECHADLKHSEFYSKLINECFKLKNKRPSMEKVSVYINNYINSKVLSLPIKNVTLNITPDKKTINIERIVRGEFCTSYFNKKEWSIIEKSMKHINPLYPEIIDLVRLITKSHEQKLFVINSNVTYAYMSIYLIIESVLVDDITHIDILKKKFFNGSCIDSLKLLKTIYNILHIFQFNMVDMIHVYLNNITEKSQRKVLGQSMFSRQGIPWGY